MFIEVIGGMFVNSDYVKEIQIEPFTDVEEYSWGITLTTTDGEKEIVHFPGVYYRGFKDAKEAMEALRIIVKKINGGKKC